MNKEGLTFKEKEDNFTVFLHNAAKEIGCVFVEESGEGHDLETETMFLEDVAGWLAPIDTPADEIEMDDNFCFAEWEMDEAGNITIEFRKYELWD